MGKTTAPSPSSLATIRRSPIGVLMLFEARSLAAIAVFFMSLSSLRRHRARFDIRLHPPQQRRIAAPCPPALRHFFNHLGENNRPVPRPFTQAKLSGKKSIRPP